MVSYKSSFKYLFNFINNEAHILLISKLVIQKVENIRRREINTAIEEINRNLKNLNKKLRKNINLNYSLIKEEYNFKQILEYEVSFLKILNNNEVNQEEIVSRALNINKPFQEGEKGYRDTILWLSLLDS